MVKVEYIVATMASCGPVWLKKLFEELFEKVLDVTMIHCDTKEWDPIGRDSHI